MRNAKYQICLAGLLLTLSPLALKAQPEQSGIPDALNVAAAIQDAVQSKSGLSDSAHQIKVTATDSHEVYLQGTVASAEERSTVENVATPFISDYKLKDELMVTSSINPASIAKSNGTSFASR